MTKSQVFKKAHKMTREIKSKYMDIDYKSQFSIYLKFIIGDIRKVKESVKSLDYMQIRDMLLNIRHDNSNDFDSKEYNVLKEKYNDNLCNEYELYRYAQLKGYTLPLENANDIKAYILHIKHTETLKQANNQVININSIQTTSKDKKTLRNAIKESIEKLKNFIFANKYILKFNN